jgi:hypothetical protein
MVQINPVIEECKMQISHLVVVKGTVSFVCSRISDILQYLRRRRHNMIYHLQPSSISAPCSNTITKSTNGTYYSFIK